MKIQSKGWQAGKENPRDGLSWDKVSVHTYPAVQLPCEAVSKEAQVFCRPGRLLNSLVPPPQKTSSFRAAPPTFLIS